MQVRCVRTNSRRSDGSMSRSVGAAKGSWAKGKSFTCPSLLCGHYQVIIAYTEVVTQCQKPLVEVRTKEGDPSRLDDRRARMRDGMIVEISAQISRSLFCAPAGLDSRA